jgi:hypothetical protein
MQAFRHCAEACRGWLWALRSLKQLNSSYEALL